MTTRDPSAAAWARQPAYRALGTKDAEFEQFRREYMTGSTTPLQVYRPELQDELSSTIGDCRKLFREVQILIQECMCIQAFMARKRSKQITELQKRKVPTYKGVWDEDQLYAESDMVTLGGSIWFCKRATHERPSTNHDDWQLAVKAGRDGRPR